MKQAFLLCGTAVISFTCLGMSDFVKLVSAQQFAQAEQQLDRLNQQELIQAKERIERVCKSNQITIDHVHHSMHINPLAGFSSLFFLRSRNLPDMKHLYTEIKAKIARAPRL